MPAYRIAATALSLLLLVGVLGMPVRTSAQNSNSSPTHLYWTSGTKVGRATIDGANITLTTVVASTEFGISVDNGYIYQLTGNAISRTDTAGSNRLPTFLTITGTNNSTNMLVAGGYIYWSTSFLTPTDKIGRVAIDGSDVRPDFITGVRGGDDLASDGTYLYWNEFGANSIGRAKLDGTSVNHSFVNGAAKNSGGVTVTASYIYWTNYDDGTIGRVGLDGTTGLTQNLFSTGPGSYPYGIVVDDSYIYWVNSGTGSIGRANLDGSSPNLNFISASDAHASYGIALGSETWMPINASAPTISGTAKVDATLTAAKGSWSGNPTPTYAYQWYRCSASGMVSDTLPSGCSAISSATRATHVVDDADYQKYLRVRVIGTNTLGSDTKYSAATAKIAGATTSNSSAPTISGTTAVGGTLTANKGSWTGYPAPTYTYQWVRCSAAGAASDALPSGCTAISGATSTTYKVDDLDYGKYLRLKVVGTNSLGADTKYSAATAKIAGLDPVNTVAPSISGTPKVGTTVTGAMGTWTGVPTPTISYQWFRCTAAGSAIASQPTGCTLISAATSSTYKLVTADKTAGYLRVRVTGTSAEGSAVRFSAAVKVQ